MFRQQNKRSRSEASKEKEEFADLEYATYQGHMANVLMMGTLIFGFCATGTFLSVTFSGDEPFEHMSYLVDFISTGLRATFFSLGASILAFVSSTRAASTYLVYGPVAAMRTIYRGIFFIGVAEIFIYLSIFEFLASLQHYAEMNYIGPDICPMSSDKKKISETDPKLWRNSSFCGQLGESFYGVAAELCSPAREVAMSKISSTQNFCEAVNRKKSDSSDSQPFALCSVFDCYTDFHQKGSAPPPPFWFGWSGYDESLGRATGEAFFDYGYKGMTSDAHVMGGAHSSVREAWDLVAKEASEANCEKSKAADNKYKSCAATSILTGTRQTKTKNGGTE